MVLIRNIFLLLLYLAASLVFFYIILFQNFLYGEKYCLFDKIIDCFEFGAVIFGFVYLCRGLF